MINTSLIYRGTDHLLSPQERTILHTQFSKDALPVFVAVSGGPDSMRLVQLIFDTFFTNSLDMSRLVILYADHRTKYMPHLFDFFADYFSPLSVIGCSFLPSVLHKETVWRKQRQQFFEEQIMRTGGTLCTGHNLTDRIETTLLNLLRGTQRRGLTNMLLKEEKNIYTRLGKFVKYTHLRPLLTLSKHTIKEICDSVQIPYRVDGSNSKPNTTKRNYLRQTYKTEYLPQNVLNQRTEFYKKIEQYRLKEEFIFAQEVTLPTPLFPKGYCFSLPQSRHELSCLLSRQKLYNGLTKAFLDELFHFLSTANSGYRYVRGWWICLAFKKVYFFPATSKTPFWKTIKTHSLGVLSPNTSRLPQPGDRYHGKLFSKRLSKKGIPFFVRPFLPVVVEGNCIKSFQKVSDFWNIDI